MSSTQIGTLVVVVLKARNLKDNHTFYKQDPYCIVRLGGAGFPTKVDKGGGQHPVWDQEFRIPVYESTDKHYRTLKLSCFSKENKVDEPLGDGELDITETLQSGEFDDWVKLQQGGQQRGEVYLECTYFLEGPAPPPKERRRSKMAAAERLRRPPTTPPKQHQSPPSSAENSRHPSPHRPSIVGQDIAYAGRPSLGVPGQLLPGQPGQGIDRPSSSPPRTPPKSPPQTGTPPLEDIPAILRPRFSPRQSPRVDGIDLAPSTQPIPANFPIAPPPEATSSYIPLTGSLSFPQAQPYQSQEAFEAPYQVPYRMPGGPQFGSPQRNALNLEAAPGIPPRPSSRERVRTSAEQPRPEEDPRRAQQFQAQPNPAIASSFRPQEQETRSRPPAQKPLAETLRPTEPLRVGRAAAAAASSNLNPARGRTEAPAESSAAPSSSARQDLPPSYDNVQAEQWRRIQQQRADEEFARRMAESEGIDIERLKREEADAELARKVASDQDANLPGAWDSL